MPTQKICPQPGPQTQFLQTPADIAVYGGAAGGGKTFALLMEFLRHIRNPQFGAVIFRRTAEQVRIEGGLWHEAQKLYPLLGAKGREQTLEWTFPSGARIRFDSLQYEKDKLGFQGSQICGLGFDELTHFTQSQFFYLLSRNRSTCGVRPYIRATTNPDATSWVKSLLAPWLQKDFPHPARPAELRWFTREDGQIRWSTNPVKDGKSITFIPAGVFDNPALLAKDPGYVANLKALNYLDRKRLLEGDWDVLDGGNLFRREWFGFVQAAPSRAQRVRFWDLAATAPAKGKDPDATVGLLLSRCQETGLFTVEDVIRLWERPLAVERAVLAAAENDPVGTAVRMEQEPGSSGVSVIDRYRNLLAGYDFRGVRSTGDKTERAKPFSAQCEAGNVRLLKAHWNAPFLDELCLFPAQDVHDDQVDAASGAFRELVRKRVIDLSFT